MAMNHSNSNLHGRQSTAPRSSQQQVTAQSAALHNSITPVTPMKTVTQPVFPNDYSIVPTSKLRAMPQTESSCQPTHSHIVSHTKYWKRYSAGEFFLFSSNTYNPLIITSEKSIFGWQTASSYGVDSDIFVLQGTRSYTDLIFLWNKDENTVLVIFASGGTPLLDISVRWRTAGFMCWPMARPTLLAVLPPSTGLPPRLQPPSRPGWLSARHWGACWSGRGPCTPTWRQSRSGWTELRRRC